MEPELKLYTIADLRNWLINNNPPVGLNEHVIAPVRAWAILNNPYVKNEDTVVAAIYDGNELAAYSACFPECMDGKRIWWATTLWCNPKFQGKGYGLIVIGSLVEAHEGELTYDRWGAPETVEIFTCLGYKTTYNIRYKYGNKVINTSSLKGKIANLKQSIEKSMHHSSSGVTVKRPSRYKLRYSTFVDGEAYIFMQTHRKNDLWLREQTMLNWILGYPFVQECAIINKAQQDTMFTSNANKYGYTVVKVYTEYDRLIGVYILRNKSSVVSVLCLYFDECAKELVYSSIVDHIQAMKAIGFETESKQLADYVERHYFFPRKVEEPISFSIPSSLLSTPNSLPITSYTFQLIDGDSFA